MHEKPELFKVFLNPFIFLILRILKPWIWLLYWKLFTMLMPWSSIVKHFFMRRIIWKKREKPSVNITVLLIEMS